MCGKIQRYIVREVESQAAESILIEKLKVDVLEPLTGRISLDDFADVLNASDTVARFWAAPIGNVRGYAVSR